MTNPRPGISIIVPAFRVEKYLPACVESIFRQTFSDWELLLIDDRGDDATSAICERYAQADSRIRVLTTDKAGPSEARNVGLDNARGEFITFLDSDDLLAANFLDACLDIISTTDADIACTSMKCIDPDTTYSEEEPFEIGSTAIYTPEFAINNMLYQKEPNNSVWSKLYKADLWHGIRFKPGILYEDLEVLPRLMPKAKKIAFNPSKLYLYRLTPGSLTRVFTKQRLDVLDVTDALVDRYRNESSPLLRSARSRRLSAYFNMTGLLAANGIKEPKLDERCRNAIREERLGAINDPNVRLRNKIMSALSIILGFRITKLILKTIYR